MFICYFVVVLVLVVVDDRNLIWSLQTAKCFPGDVLRETRWALEHWCAAVFGDWRFDHLVSGLSIRHIVTPGGSGGTRITGVEKVIERPPDSTGPDVDQ